MLFKWCCVCKVSVVAKRQSVAELTVAAAAAGARSTSFVSIKNDMYFYIRSFLTALAFTSFWVHFRFLIFLFNFFTAAVRQWIWVSVCARIFSHAKQTNTYGWPKNELATKCGGTESVSVYAHSLAGSLWLALAGRPSFRMKFNEQAPGRVHYR